MKIVGNTVGTSLPKPNLMQDDPKKGDFVKGKDEFKRKSGVNIPGGAKVGQMIVVKAVDENGKPTEWEAVDMPEQVNSDWNQNDPNAPGYVENRPFFTDTELKLAEEHHGVVFENNGGIYYSGYISINYPNVFTDDPDGTKYKVVLGDREYVSTKQNGCIGNGSIYSPTYPDTGEPFCITGAIMEMEVYSTEPINGDTVAVYVYSEQTKQLDEKFIPDSIARKTEISGAVMTVMLTKLSNGKYTFNKSFDEITKAIDDGKYVHALYNGHYYRLSNVTSSQLLFDAVLYDGTNLKYCTFRRNSSASSATYSERIISMIG